MAENIEMTTWPKHKFIFYRVSSNAFTVEVKGLGNAIIGLTSSLKTKAEFFILIDCNANTSITKNTANGDNRNVGQRTPNLLSPNEYRRFWVTWYGGILAFGRFGETTSIVSLADPSSNNMKYITFGSYKDRNAVHWKFDLPPLLPQPALKPISDGKLQWVEADTQLPDGAVIGGYENEFLYIIRAPHRGSLTPGKFVPSLGLGFISWGGSSHEKTDFEVLRGYDCAWVTGHLDKIPANAVEAGYVEDTLERMYVGRVKHNGHLIPGKVCLSHKVCYIAFGDREVAFSNYEVLVCPNPNALSANRTFALSLNQLSLQPLPDRAYGSEYDDEDDDASYYEEELPF